MSAPAVAAPEPPRAAGLRRRVLAPVLALALPLAVFAAIVMGLLWDHQRDAMWQRHETTARTVSIAIAREVRETRERVELLASWPSLLSSSPELFPRNAADLLRARRDWQRITLVDPDGRVLRSVTSPHAAPSADATEGATPAPPAALPADEPLAARALKEGRTAISEFRTDDDGTPVVAFATPTSIDGVPRVLVVALRLGWFDALLADFARDGTIAGLFDAGTRSIARSRDAERIRGKPAPPTLASGLTSRPEGRAQLNTFDGRPADAVWVGVPGTPWRVVMGFPADTFLAPLRRELGLLVAAGLGALVLGVAVALRTGGRLRDSIDAIGHTATALLQGRSTRLAPTGTVELDRLGATLERAAEKLREAERQRDALLAGESRAREAAEEANRAKDEFLAMLSHELRNPLAPLTNALHVLDRVGTADSRGRDALAMARRQSAHLARLVDDLLEAQRLVRGRIELERARLAVDAVLREAGEAAAAEAASHGHALVVELPAAPLHVDGDPVRVAQMLGNLLGNAIKYTPEGGRIVLGAQAVDGFVELRVTDTGIGIEPGTIARVFELFHQVDAGLDRSAGGLGIGLALVDRLARLHGSHARATSGGRGKGATFVVALPQA